MFLEFQISFNVPPFMKLKTTQFNGTFFQFQDEKKKKKSNKIVELPIVVRTHGYSQVEFDKYFELEVCKQIATPRLNFNTIVFVFFRGK